MRQKAKAFPASRLFIYYNERKIEGTVQEDAGAMIRDGMKVVNKLGVCPETLWPYSDKNPGPFQKEPSAAAYKEARKHTATTYQRVPRTLRSMQARLASGFPFIFGFSVYSSFESPVVSKTGEVPMPRPNEEALGGHAVLAVGYDEGTATFSRPQLVGARLGQQGLLHDAVRVPARRRPGRRLLDDTRRLGMSHGVIALDEKAAGSTIALAVGEEAELSLAENPTTGFRWRLPPDAPDVVALVADRFTPGARPGQGGVRLLRWRGERAGTARLTLVLGRSWQAGGARTFALTLVVRS